MYGYDFRNYAYPSIRRRIWHRINAWKLPNISALQEKVLHEPGGMDALLTSLIINVTDMFRDPHLFAAFRRKVVPVLRTHPFVRIWHAGCSTGEEVLSMAILLYEEGLYDKVKIYATDMGGEVLDRARTGIFPLRKMQDYTRNYLLAGGTGVFSEYYSVKNEQVVFQPFLMENIVFAQHNLVTDHSFNEFNVIFCRNVMIYFNKQLQDQVHNLFYDSLSTHGFLALGNRESINFSKRADGYETIDFREKLYRKMK